MYFFAYMQHFYFRSKILNIEFDS